MSHSLTKQWSGAVRVGTRASSGGWKTAFALVWGGQAFSLVGSALVRFTLIWWLTARTGSATTLALAALLSRLPVLALGPFVGALIDRWNRRRTMIVSDAIIALFTGVLALLYWLEVAQPWHVYLILFLRALGDTVHSPTMRATTPLMVPKDQLTRVAGMNQTLDGVIKIAIPPAGALLLALLPMGSILAIDVLTALLAIVPLVLTQIPQPKATRPPGAQQPRGPSSLLREIGEGLRYVWSWRGLFLLIATSALIQLSVAPAAALLPLWVTQHLNGEALHVGWINSAFGIGIVAGGFLLSLWGGFKRRIVTSQLGTFGVGVGLLAMGLTPSSGFGLALSGMFLVGLMLPVCSAPRLAIYQSSIPPEMQGRFFTLNDSLLQVMAPLGLAVSGPLSDVLGVRAWIALAGASCMVIGVARALTPCIRQIEERVPA